MADGVKQVGRDVRQENSAAPVLLTVSSSTATSTVLTKGLYIITSDVDLTFLQGASTVTATTSHRRLWGGTYRWVWVTRPSVDGYIAAITTGATGTLSIEKVSSNDGVVGL